MVKRVTISKESNKKHSHLLEDLAMDFAGDGGDLGGEAGG